MAAAAAGPPQLDAAAASSTFQQQRLLSHGRASTSRQGGGGSAALPGRASEQAQKPWRASRWRGSSARPSHLGVSLQKLAMVPQKARDAPLDGPAGLKVVCNTAAAVATIGELVAAGSAATVGASSSGTHMAIGLVTQVAITAAAVVYGAYLSPYADTILGREDKNLAGPVMQLVIDGVDVTGYAIFREPQVTEALVYAREAHKDQTRKTGEPYITHCIHTARILAALIPSSGQRAVDTIVAGILHDVVDDGRRTLTEVRKYFGKDVATLVEGVSRLSHINQLLRRHRRSSAGKADKEVAGLSSADVNSLRHMMLGMVDDARVVLIKLADRLHNMRTIYALPPEKARAVAQETMAVWCSMASNIGMWAIRAELEDLCFAPRTFRRLRSELAAMWSPDKNWRNHRRMTKRAKRRALIYGEEAEESLPLRDPEDEEDVSMKDLLQAVVPFDVLLDRSRRPYGLGSDSRLIIQSRPQSSTSSSQETSLTESRVPKVVRDAEVALAALGACEEALDKELLITTPYIPGMEITLSGRLKSLYSAHCKMRRKGVGLDQVYDGRALRVVVGDDGGRLHASAVEGCYSLLGVVHSLWTPIGGEFDDYIVNPKPSGYQSLHTAVTGPDGAPLEVQIRTKGMHEYAEMGNAAHWLYKEEGNRDFSAEALADRPAELNERRQRSPKGPPYSLFASDQVASEDPAGERPSPMWAQARLGKLGHPALRIEEGRLLAAVVVEVNKGGKELLVAVSFALYARDAVAAGRSKNQRRRWETYAKLYKKVKDLWWNAPGHGDWSTCLEKYTLCKDGIYHKEDQFGRALPTFIQLLDLSQEEHREYIDVMALVKEGRVVELQEKEPVKRASIQEQETGEEDDEGGLAEPRAFVHGLNNKAFQVRWLRSMLQWEPDLARKETAALSEVLVIQLPGDILRMPAGSCAADVAALLGMEDRLVYINNRAVLPSTRLKDGDVVQLRGHYNEK
eukprot:SM000241S08515  [mRNA]  locus=s241:144841:151628:+ [translate_table: standard]